MLGICPTGFDWLVGLRVCDICRVTLVGQMVRCKARRHELLKGVPTSTPTPLDVDLNPNDPTWPHVDLDPGRPDMNYYLQQLCKKLFSSFAIHIDPCRF